MHAQWTADLIGEMHLYSITSKQLAETIGWNSKYLSAVLNGHRNPKHGEKKLKDALNSLICEQKVDKDNNQKNKREV